MNIIPIEGLCNRLRVILSYLKINKNLNIYWPIDNKICFSHFLDVFEEIENIKFLYTEPKSFSYKGFSPYCSDYNNEFLHLIPKNHVIKRLEFIINLLGENYNACHIRRTDHIRLAVKHKCLVTDYDFIKFIQNSDKKVYIATDNIITQIKFKQIFGNKVILNDGISNKNTLRNSTLADAVIDLIICSNAKTFKGSSYSSFTDTINILNKINYFQKIINPLLPKFSNTIPLELETLKPSINKLDLINDFKSNTVFYLNELIKDFLTTNENIISYNPNIGILFDYNKKTITDFNIISNDLETQEELKLEDNPV